MNKKSGFQRTGRMMSFAKWAMAQPNGIKKEEIPKEILQGMPAVTAITNLIRSHCYTTEEKDGRIYVLAVKTEGRSLLCPVRGEMEGHPELTVRFHSLTEAKAAGFEIGQIRKSIAKKISHHAGYQWFRE